MTDPRPTCSSQSLPDVGHQIAQEEARCESAQEAFGGTVVRCEREHGHGGAHTATIDDPALDPLYKYVVSWWPKGQDDG